jgi:hypothetical protein
LAKQSREAQKPNPLISTSLTQVSPSVDHIIKPRNQIEVSNRSSWHFNKIEPIIWQNKVEQSRSKTEAELKTESRTETDRSIDPENH